MGGLVTRYRVLGIIFIALLLLAVWLTYATFTKQFADYDKVTLETDTIGLQLPTRADVKIRGVIVGEVLNTAAEGEQGAKVTLGIYPDKLNEIPANVSGAIVPKTLFGEKYVSLVIPKSGPVGTMQTGAVIQHTAVSAEVEQVLNDLYPLLRTVRPADLNNTLNAISTALEGRGAKLGQNLEIVDSYLKRINPQIPKLLGDLEMTAKVSNTYADILPQVATILDNTVKTTGTLQAKSTALSQELRDITSFANTARVFLDQNQGNLVESGRLSTLELQTLARYSPEIPCMAKTLVRVHGRLAQAFRGFELHIILETLPKQPNAYTPADRPHFGAAPGPSCHGLPDNFHYSQAHPYPGLPYIADGVRRRQSGKGNAQRVAPGFGLDPNGFQGTPHDVAVLRKMLAQSYHNPANDDLAVLQAGPLAADGGS